MTTPWHKLPLKHVVDSQQFTKEALDVIFAEALKMEKVGSCHQPPRHKARATRRAYLAGPVRHAIHTV